MKIPATPHRWTVSPRQAVAIQQRLALQVRDDVQSRTIRLVAGVDAAFSAGEEGRTDSRMNRILSKHRRNPSKYPVPVFEVPDF